MAGNYQLHTRGLGVEVVLKNSTVLKGRIFLHERAERHDGAETVGDMLGAPQRFFPLAVRQDGERALLVNKEQVLFVRVGQDPRHIDIHEPRASTWAVQVSLEMIQGAPISGVVFFAQPPGRDRTLDGLNESSGFLCLVQDAAFLYVNLQNVVSVRERGPQFESVPPPAP